MCHFLTRWMCSSTIASTLVSKVILIRVPALASMKPTKCCLKCLLVQWGEARGWRKLRTLRPQGSKYQSQPKASFACLVVCLTLNKRVTNKVAIFFNEKNGTKPKTSQWDHAVEKGLLRSIKWEIRSDFRPF